MDTSIPLKFSVHTTQGSWFNQIHKHLNLQRVFQRFAYWGAHRLIGSWNPMLIYYLHTNVQQIYQIQLKLNVKE